MKQVLIGKVSSFEQVESEMPLRHPSTGVALPVRFIVHVL